MISTQRNAKGVLYSETANISIYITHIVWQHAV